MGIRKQSMVGFFAFSVDEAREDGYCSYVMNEPDPDRAAAELKAMQDDIYREKILRARRQTPEERLADVFVLSNSAFARMHEGAMWQAGITDEKEGWEIVRKRLARLQKMHDSGRFVCDPSSTHP
jgi:hypothetical protein